MTASRGCSYSFEMIGGRTLFPMGSPSKVHDIQDNGWRTGKILTTNTSGTNDLMDTNTAIYDDFSLPFPS